MFGAMQGIVDKILDSGGGLFDEVDEGRKEARGGARPFAQAGVIVLCMVVSAGQEGVLEEGHLQDAAMRRRGEEVDRAGRRLVMMTVGGVWGSGSGLRRCGVKARRDGGEMF